MLSLRVVVSAHALISLVASLMLVGPSALAGPTLPGQPCQTSPMQVWTNAEKWVWNQICEGKVADFNGREGVALDPLDPDGWSRDRSLSSSFLEVLMLHEPYLSSVTRKGLRIVGAWFPEPVDLEGVQINFPLWLDQSRFEARVSLRSMSANNSVSLEGSRVSGVLDMRAIKIAGDLALGGTAKFNRVILNGAMISGSADMSGVIVDDTLEMRHAKIGRHLFMRQGYYRNTVLMSGAKIGGQIDVSSARFNGPLDMDSIEVTGSLFMRDGSEFEAVDLSGAKIGGQVAIDGSRFTDSLKMDSVEIAGSLLARDVTFPTSGIVSIRFAMIGSSLDLSGSALTTLDLTATKVIGELRLGPTMFNEAPIWKVGSKLILRNTVVQAIQVHPNSWPQQSVLEGFSYSRFGDLGGEPAVEATGREVEWFVSWLASDITYSPEPYYQLARVLRRSGEPTKANEVLYVSRAREQALARGADFLELAVMDALIGYGIKPHRAIYWFFAMVLLGGILFRLTPQGKSWTVVNSMLYSLDALLPAVTLRKAHEEIDLEKWPRYYFYGLRVSGYLFVLVIVKLADKVLDKYILI